jgi:ferredoxin-NADP reductase
VSSFLHEVVMPGDELEVRGPIGGWFVWRGNTPALLVGGGSGVVPLMAMLRLARRDGRAHLLRLVVSARSPADLYYAGELPGPETTVIYSRAAPPGWARPPGRLNRDDLAGVLAPEATAYVCGSPGFADAATDLLIGAGVAPGRIRVERFGPTG